MKTNPGTVANQRNVQEISPEEPSSVKKQKIDIGDTWVGLGKAGQLDIALIKKPGIVNRNIFITLA